MKVAVESVVPVKCGGPVKSGRSDKSGVPAKSGRPAKSGGPVETMAAMASAAMTPCDAWRCGNDQERKGEEGCYNCPTHTAYLCCRPLP